MRVDRRLMGDATGSCLGRIRPQGRCYSTEGVFADRRDSSAVKPSTAALVRDSSSGASNSDRAHRTVANLPPLFRLYRDYSRWRRRLILAPADWQLPRLSLPSTRSIAIAVALTTKPLSIDHGPFCPFRTLLLETHLNSSHTAPTPSKILSSAVNAKSKRPRCDKGCSSTMLNFVTSSSTLKFSHQKITLVGHWISSWNCWRDL